MQSLGIFKGEFLFGLYCLFKQLFYLFFLFVLNRCGIYYGKKLIKMFILVILN